MVGVVNNSQRSVGQKVIAFVLFIRRWHIESPGRHASSAHLFVFREIDHRPIPPLRSEPADVLCILDARQKRSDLVEFSVSRIVDKGRAINGILRVEQIRIWRVIYDDGTLQIPVQDVQVLHVVPLVKDTRLPEQPVPYDLVSVQQIQQRVGVLVETGGVYHNLVVFGHFQQEFVYARSLSDVDKVNYIFDPDRDDKIGTIYRSETRMH
mmetsp:Transcript_29146/g.62451  ORF Transcript_29146/g.62451 Transcript_29146/m.62451 type:complete len:209 (-) Transcript_29146:672-1298(-)